jgi:thiamine biosynthesis lipoprotein
VAIDRELFDLIAKSIAYSVLSDGAFDITVGPLMKAWGFFDGDGHLPDGRALAAARERVGYRFVTLDPALATVAFAREGVELDLGGIGKGYAVDRVVALLRRRGIGAALVGAGGSTIYGLGSPPGTSGWPVDVQDPAGPSRRPFAVTLRNRALSIAGGSEKFFEARGVRYSHIMDPRTGRPVQGVSTVVVLSDDGTTGDALDDALFVLGRGRGRRLLRAQPGVDAFVADGTGRLSRL